LKLGKGCVENEAEILVVSSWDSKSSIFFPKGFKSVGPLNPTMFMGQILRTIEKLSLILRMKQFQKTETAISFQKQINANTDW
jgi:hypothetical protein